MMGETIMAGALEFHAEERNTGNTSRDGGPSLQVYIDDTGTRTQILRFDMFRISPHYHYAPMGEDLRYNLDPLTLDDGISWTIGLLSRKLPQVLAKAGYERVATPDNLAVAEAALPEIERRWRAACAQTATV
jgi:hypothetical protein